jgi:predicted PurR-regulated permease PerM
MARPVELTGRGSRFIILASICLMVAALYFGREVLIPLALAVLLTFLLSPPVGWLERLRLPRVAATLIVIVIAVGAVVTIGYVVEMQFVSVVEDFPKYEHELRQKLAKLSSHLGIFRKAEQEFHNFGIGDAASTQPAQTNTGAAPGGKAGGTRLTPTTQPTTETPVPVRIVASESGIIQTVRDWAARVLDPLATAGLVLILMIFMLLNREDLRDRIIRLAGHGRLNVTTQALDDAGSRISRYLGALAIVNSAYGVCVAAGLWAAGRLFGHGTSFPNVMVWGMLVGLFRFVPYLGIWIGASVPLLLSFALFPGSAVFFAVLSLFIMMEIIVAQFVEPNW